MSNEGRVVISGDSTGVIASMQQAARAVRGFETDASRSLGGVQAMVGGLHARFVALAATLVSGAGMKQAADRTMELNKAAEDLGRQLGVSASEAQILSMALGEAHVEKEVLISAADLLTQRLNKNEQAFSDLGVRTRDSNGNFRNTVDVMRDVSARLAQFNEGTDRNIEGAKIYGRQWTAMSETLKLNEEMMERARAKAAALNLVITEEGQAATAAYEDSMKGVSDVLLGLQNAVGEGVMPVLTQLGKEFAETGPQKVEFMRRAVSVLVVGFYGLKNGVEVTWIAIRGQIQAGVTAFLTFGDVARRAIRLDFSGAKQAYQNGMGQIKDIVLSTAGEIADVSEKNGDAIRRALDLGFGDAARTPTADPNAGNNGARSSGGEGGKETSRVKEWDGLLDQQKQAHLKMNVENATFQEFSKEREAEYWRTILQRQDLNQKERLEVERKVTKLMLDIQRERFDAEQEALKLGIDAAKDSYAGREIYMAKYVENAKRAFGEESKQYQAALREQEAMKRDHEQKLQQMQLIRLESIKRDAEVVVEESGRVAQMEYELGLITREQLIQLQRGFIQEKMRLDLEAADHELALLTAGTVEYEQAMARRAEVKRRYDTLLRENDIAGTLERNRPQANIFSTLESNLERSSAAVLMRAQSLRQALGGIWQGVGQAMVQELVTKPFAAWAAGWVRKLAMNMGFLQAENAQEAAAAAISGGIAVTKATTEIGANAAAAGAGAAASQASIPIIGPGLALAAMAMIFAAVSGMGGKVKSASGGFDIPRGMNPMTQLHEEEMVLPAPLSNGIRNMIAGGAGQGGGGAPQVIYNDHSGRLSDHEIRRKAGVIAKVLADHMRKS